MKTFAPEGAVAFVTGTNKKSGIGRAIVHALLDAGAKRVYATARDVTHIQDLVKDGNGRVVPVSLDVTDDRAVDDLGSRFPDVNLLVNNAGLLAGSPSWDDPEGAIEEIRVNYLGPLRVTQSFVPVFAEARRTDPQARSAIVNINSIASLVSVGGGTYSASKAATHSLTQAQRRHLSKTLVIGVYPGPTDTEMAVGVPLEKVPPTAVAQAVVEALKNGQEDVFPDPISNQLYAGWKADAKGLEQHIASTPLGGL